MPKGRSHITPIEWIVLAAIAGVMISAVTPAVQKAKRDARLQRSQAAHNGRAAEPAGQLNTIKPPDASPGSPEQSHQSRRRTPRAGGLVSLAILTAMVALLLRFVSKLARRQAAQRRRRRHEGPDATC